MQNECDSSPLDHCQSILIKDYFMGTANIFCNTDYFTFRNTCTLNTEFHEIEAWNFIKAILFVQLGAAVARCELSKVSCCVMRASFHTAAAQVQSPDWVQAVCVKSFVSYLPQAGGFLRILRFPPPKNGFHHHHFTALM